MGKNYIKIKCINQYFKDVYCIDLTKSYETKNFSLIKQLRFTLKTTNKLCFSETFLVKRN